MLCRVLLSVQPGGVPLTAPCGLPTPSNGGVWGQSSSSGLNLERLTHKEKTFFSVYINTYIYLGDVYIKMFMAALTVKERW